MCHVKARDTDGHGMYFYFHMLLRSLLVHKEDATSIIRHFDSEMPH